MVEYLDKDKVACCDEDVVACLDDGVLECLNNNIKNDFDVDLFHAHPWNIFLRKYWGVNV